MSFELTEDTVYIFEADVICDNLLEVKKFGIISTNQFQAKTNLIIMLRNQGIRYVTLNLISEGRFVSQKH